jgi:hypothetical protein
VLLTLGAYSCAADPVQQSPALALQPVPPTPLERATSAPTEYLAVDVKATSAGDGDIVCEREAKTGSHWKRKVCRTRDVVELERAASQEWLRTGGFSGSPTVVR